MWPSLRTQLVPTRCIPTQTGELSIRVCVSGTEILVACKPGSTVFHLVSAEVQMHGGHVDDFVVLNASGETVAFDCSLLNDMQLKLLPKAAHDQFQGDTIELPGFDDEELACLRTGKGLDFPMDFKGPLPVHQAQINPVENDVHKVVDAFSRETGGDVVSVPPDGVFSDLDDPLCKVGKNGFLCMPCPRILDVEALADFRNQSMSKHSNPCKSRFDVG